MSFPLPSNVSLATHVVVTLLTYYPLLELPLTSYGSLRSLLMGDNLRALGGADHDACDWTREPWLGGGGPTIILNPSLDARGTGAEGNRRL
ncbi:hypothetical protein PoB_003076400 [Plakobranchus ocellatus]|uniref:Uncharacterized protein n=1 Tax=Plakobranchus ocellatus TaxID=259542 RepID=A0AAV4ADH1_9GAST|nr:hypothetical protein PoB_003076400 [Plakobranchus ocellatus]